MSRTGFRSPARSSLLRLATGAAFLFALLPFVLRPSAVSSEGSPGRLVEIRHAVHTEHGFSRLVFEIEGAVRLRVLGARRPGDALRIALEGVRSGREPLRCKTSGAVERLQGWDVPGGALCILEGDLLEAAEIRGGERGQVLATLHLREVRAGELLYKHLRLPGSLANPENPRLSRQVIDLRLAPLSAHKAGGWRRLPAPEPVKTAASPPPEREPLNRAAFIGTAPAPALPREEIAGPTLLVPEAPTGAGHRETRGRGNGTPTLLSERGSAGENLPPPRSSRLPAIISPALARPMVTALQGGTEGRSAALQLARNAVRHWLPAIGESMPDWTKRIEFEVDFEESKSADYSLLTVQPLLQSEDAVETLFTQLRVDDSTFNAGLGYRRLFLNHTVLAGVNGFYDLDYENNHRRAGAGVELLWNAFDFRANLYEGLSDRHSVGGLREEEALSGYDYELTSQIPYVPWARFHAAQFHWNSKDSKNLEGYRLSLEMDLHPNFQLEAGYRDDNRNDAVWFAQLRFWMADTRRPVATSTKPFDRVPFRARDMRDHTLQKVRRENTVVVERKTVYRGNIVVVRKD